MTDNKYLLLIGLMCIAPHMPPKLAILFGTAVAVASIILELTK